MASSVGKSTVVPCDGKGGKGLALLQADKGPCGGVVHLGAAPETLLKQMGVLSKVMGQSSQAALFLCVKGGGELGCAAGCALQMVL